MEWREGDISQSKRAGSADREVFKIPLGFDKQMPSDTLKRSYYMNKEIYPDFSLDEIPPLPKKR